MRKLVAGEEVQGFDLDYLWKINLLRISSIDINKYKNINKYIYIYICNVYIKKNHSRMEIQDQSQRNIRNSESTSSIYSKMKKEDLKDFMEPILENYRVEYNSTLTGNRDCGKSRDGMTGYDRNTA